MGFKISLNGSNYVSEAREAAFEEALAESQETMPVQNTGPVYNIGPVNDTGPAQTTGVAQIAEPVRNTKVAQRGNGNGHQGAHEPAATPAQAVDRSPEVRVEAAGRVLDGLERGLTQSYDHQSEMLRVHQQYLSNQAAYADLFAALMEEQGALFTPHGDSTPSLSGERIEALLQVLRSLNRSVEQFHAHQSETLDVHGQFLAQQATYAQAFIELLQSHYGAALNGHGPHHNGNGHKPGLSAEVNRAPAPNEWRVRRETDTDAVSHSAAAHSAGAHSVGAHSVGAPSRYTSPVGPGPGEAGVGSEPAPKAAASSAPDPGPERESAAPSHRDAGARPAPGLDAEMLSKALLDIVSDKTGYPAEMLDLEMDMEADLGIDSIKRVEILGALQDAVPGLPDIEADTLVELRTLAQVLNYVAQAAPSVEVEVVDGHEGQGPGDAGQDMADNQDLSQDLLRIVSEKTGYPAEMLDLEMDMEADLGIDSIKRVEILGALQDQYPDLPEVEADALVELRTLAEILVYMAHSSPPVTSTDGEGDSKKA